MKRIGILVVMLLTVVSAVLVAHDPYDSEVVVPIMRSNLGAFRQLRTAQSEGDFLSAAGALSIIAQGSFRLSHMAAPQGDQNEWERIHTNMVTSALRGIQACSEEDTEALAEVVAAVGANNQEGHGQFR